MPISKALWFAESPAGWYLLQMMAMPTRREDLIARIKDEEERIAALRSDIADRHASNSDKLILFRSLFRGREDVFPLRWENPKTGRCGFSPACANEWNNELCHKGKARSARSGSAATPYSLTIRARRTPTSGPCSPA
jgi:hypothetical protein